MKAYAILAIMACLLSGAAFGQAITLNVDALPSSMEELVSLRDRIAVKPEGGAVVFILAMKLYGSDPELGLQAFTLALDMDELISGEVYKGYKPKRIWDEKWDQIRKFPFLGGIYVKGSKAETAYALPSGPLSFTITELRGQVDGTVKAYVATTSGNMPRPVLLRKNDKGLWKVIEASSLFVGPSALPPVQKKDEL